MILKRIILCVLLALLCCVQNYAGASASQNASEKEVIEIVNKQFLPSGDLEILRKILHKAADALPNTSEAIISNVFIANKTASEKDALNATSTVLFRKSLAAAKKLKRQDLELWVAIQYGFYLYTYRKYEETFPLFMSSIHILDKIETDKVISPSETYKKLSYFLMTAEDYEKADELLLKAKQYAVPNSAELAAIIDNLGLNSIGRNKLAKARHYFDEALLVAAKAKDKLRYAKVLGNMATIKFKQKHYLAAINLLKQDIAVSKRLQSTQNTIFALVMLGKVHLANNDIVNANETLHDAQAHAQYKTYLQSSDYEINTLILEIAKKTGNDKDELAARRKLDVQKKSLAYLDGKEVITKVGWKLEKEKLQLSLAAEKTKREKETLQKTLAIIACIVLVAAMVLGAQAYRKKIKHKESEFDEKLNRLSLAKEKSEEKLKVNSQTLHSYQTYLEEKNDQIKELELEMDKIKQSATTYEEKYRNEIAALLQSHLLDNDAWIAFKRAFIQEHSNYYQNLVQNFKDLTEANLRVIFLLKLGMNNMEIARILGLTSDAVKKAKQRLKLKYGNSYENLLN